MRAYLKSKRKNLLLFGAVLVALAGTSVSCSTIRRAPEVVQRDSLVIHIVDSTIYRDSVVMVEVPAESESATIPDTDTSRLSTSVAVSSAWVHDGLLYHDLRNRPEAIPVPVVIKDKLVTEHKEYVRVVYREVEVEKELTGWQSAKMYMGMIAFSAIGLAILFFVIKMLVRRRV